MLDRDGQDVALLVQIEKGVLVQIAGFRDRSVTELDLERVRVCEVTDFYDTNLLSKNALCTVSPSARSTTRRYLLHPVHLLTEHFPSLSSRSD